MEVLYKSRTDLKVCWNLQMICISTELSEKSDQWLQTTTRGQWSKCRKKLTGPYQSLLYLSGYVIRNTLKMRTLRKVPGHQNLMIMQEHVDSNGASPLANLKASRKSLNRYCGREEANVVRQAGSLVSAPETGWVEGFWSGWRRRTSHQHQNRVCFNEFGQMNDINVGQGSKDWWSVRTSQNTSLSSTTVSLLKTCPNHLSGKTRNLNSGKTVDKPQKSSITC